MTRNVGCFICILILAIDASAGILAIQAEIAQNKVKHLKMSLSGCREPSYTAFKCGLAACVLLVLAHATSNFLGGCLCIVSRKDLVRSSANKQLAVASLVFSWIILVVGFSMLMVGTMANSRRKPCGIPHHRVLSLGGTLCFIHSLFAIAYYLSATAATREQTSTDQT